MENKINAFRIMGISVRTTNENGQATKDIPLLWSKFFTDNIAVKVPGRIGEEIYCVYTDYEKDHTKPYTTILGYKVNDEQLLEDGLVEKYIDPGMYHSIHAKGKHSENFVYKAWLDIWNSSLNRTFTSDFEVYGTGYADPENAEMDIYIAVN